MPQTGARNDPFRTFNFVVSVDGIEVAGFHEAGGLTVETESVEYRRGDSLDNYPVKLTGLSRFPNITLARGQTADLSLYRWYVEVLNGTVERRDGSVELLSEARESMLRWDFFGGWICKWEGPAFNASANEVAIERIEICVESVKLVEP